MRHHTMHRAALAAMIVALAATGAALAARATAPVSDTPAYDTNAEFTIKGTVSEVKTHDSIAGYRDEHLVIATEKGDIEVHLAPEVYLAKKGFQFAKGDEVVVTGSKTRYEGIEVLVAREVTKSGRVLTVRNSRGDPSWPKKLHG